jgi:hypothetical protein
MTKRNLATIATVALAGLALSVPAFAQDGHQNQVNDRVQDTNQRINQEYRDGDISRNQEHQLKDENRDIKHEEQAQARDGLSHGEQRSLNQQENSLNHQITHDSHN